MGRTDAAATGDCHVVGFQLTRPVWGEPQLRRSGKAAFRHFNSLAPCGANLDERVITFTDTRISTHSPRVGRTAIFVDLPANVDDFNSLAPCGANQAAS